MAEQRTHSERELADLRARFESELAKQSAVLRASLQQNFSKAMELFQEGRERGHQKVKYWKKKAMVMCTPTMAVGFTNVSAAVIGGTRTLKCFG